MQENPEITILFYQSDEKLNKGLCFTASDNKCCVNVTGLQEYLVT